MFFCAQNCPRIMKSRRKQLWNSIARTRNGFRCSCNAMVSIIVAMAATNRIRASWVRIVFGWLCTLIRPNRVYEQHTAWKHETFDRRWHSNTPNYYFPKSDQYPDMRAATIVFFVSATGLVVLISGIVLLLYRMGHWARDHRDPQSRHLNTISELLDSHHMDAEEENISEELDPPAYEEPPAYDEVIKVGMDEIYAKAKRKLASHNEQRQRRRSRRCVNCRRLVSENGVALAVGDCAVDAPNAIRDDANVGGSDQNTIAFSSAPPDYNTPSVIIRCNNCRRDSAIDCGNIAVDDTSSEQHLISLSSTSDILMTTPSHLIAGEILTTFAVIL